MPTALELRTKRATLVTEARQLLDRSSGPLSAEDSAQYDRIQAEIDALGARVEQEERQAALEAETARTLPTVAARREQPAADERARGDAFEFRGTRIEPRPENRAAMNAWLRGGPVPAFASETRALQADSDIAGGYLRPDQEFTARLIQAVDNLVYIRQRATVMSLSSADSMGVPVLDADVSDPSWTSELLVGSEDSTMAMGRRELRPHPLAKYIKVSKKLLRQTGQPGAVDAESLVRERLAYKIAVAQENAFMTGTGAGQPLGVFTASALGISTGRDVATGNSTTAVAADNLFEVKYSLKTQYWPRAEWIFNRSVLKAIRKLKDGDGQYLWAPGLTGGQPDRILDCPVNSSEYAPNTMTSGLYVGILGDFSKYWIADSLNLQIQRLIELYAATNQDGFFARLETDGMPVLEEAFVRVTLA